MRPLLLLPLAAVAACTPAATPAARPAESVVPQVDFHQHLVSQAFAPIVKRPERDGTALLRELDTAGIQRAVVLSVGYSFADERKALPDPAGLTKAENDWTSAQVARTGGRLIGFCGANPLRPEALEELERCLALPGMVGIKQHLGNAGVTLRDSAHLRRMQQVFALAQRRGAPMLMHMRARGGANYGGEDARLFLSQVVPQAPDVEIIVAHLGYSGPGYPLADSVMAAFGEAAERKDPAMRHLYFDVATNVAEATTPAEAALVARRIRQVGAARVLYGSDLTPPGGSIRGGWEIFRSKTPLTDAEFRQIAGNRPRFTR
jgi:predicted TIM-barrel fold metal-dependent hydrolase